MQQYRISKGLKFLNKNMPEHLMEVYRVEPDNNCLDVLVTRIDGTGDGFVDHSWNLQHTVWGFEKGEYVTYEPVSAPSEDKLEILKRHYFAYYRQSYPSDERTREVVDMALSIKEETACIMAAMDEYKGQPQSEGGLQWVKDFEGSLKRELASLREFQEKVKEKESNDFDFAQRSGKILALQKVLILLERFCSSTANTEEERLNKEITGFNSVAERVAYDEGYSANQKVMMQWIEKWDGSTNSGLGALLARRFKELNTEEGAEPKVRSLEQQGYDCIEIGDTIKLYGKETKVKNFAASFNQALGRWETIIITEGRGDPFERSIDVIEVWHNEENKWIPATSLRIIPH